MKTEPLIVAAPAALGSASLKSARTAAVIEVTAMIALLLSYIWGWQGAFRGSFITLLVLYFGLGLVSHIRRGETPRDIGLRIDNVPRALVNAAIIFVPVIALALLIGLALDSWHFRSLETVVAGAPWMLAWALAQQYGLLCFLYRRFLDIFGTEQRAAASASLAFALFHVPNPFLVPVTLAAGLAACTLYRREPNVLVIGLAHAMTSYSLLCSLPVSITYGLRVGPGFFALH